MAVIAVWNHLNNRKVDEIVAISRMKQATLTNCPL